MIGIVHMQSNITQIDYIEVGSLLYELHAHLETGNMWMP